MRTLIRAILCVAAVAVSAPVAAQAPPVLPLQGFVTDADGVPLNGPIIVDVAIYDVAVGGEPLFEESLFVVADAGYFSADVGLTEILDLTIFRDASETWAELTIDGDVLEPRLAFGTVPYAAWADFAGDAATLQGMTAEELAATSWEAIDGVPEDLLDGDDRLEVGEGLSETEGVAAVDTEIIQRRVATACDEGSAIRAIAADGTVVCHVDVDTDTDTTYSAGDGLSLLDAVFAIDATTVQRRVEAECAEGSSIRAIAEDGTVVCHVDVDTDTDTDTTYAAGAGLALLDTVFSVDPTTVQARVASQCAEGSAIRAIAEDGSVLCHVDVDTDTDTTYAAGDGLALADSTFSVDADAVQYRVVGSCGEGSAIREVLADGSVVCQPLAEGSGDYIAGTGIDITGGIISVREDGITGTEILDGAVGKDELEDESVDEDEIDLQGTRVVYGATPRNIWSRLLVTSRTPFTKFRVMLTVNGLTGGGSTTPGGDGTVTFDLAQDCQTAFGGDQTISVAGTPSGGYPLVYVSEEFDVGAIACFIAVRVSAAADKPVVVREVQLLPTAW